MGMYDSFMDGEKEVQLKNFDKSMHIYRIGDRVRVLECGYPKTCIFYCYACPREIVLVMDQIFKGIITREQAEKMEFTEIYDCSGKKENFKEFIYKTLMEKI